jgi:transmembrane sensor
MSAPSVNRAPQAGGMPIRPATAEAAAEWLTLLMSGEASAQQRQDWQQWRHADPEHERAWRHIEAVAARFQQLDGAAASRSLVLPDGRRRAVKALLALAVTAGGGVLMTQTPAGRQWRADYAAATGTRRDITLADGSRLTLNSGSAITVDFDGERRLVRLLEGEIMITTGHGHGQAGGAALPPFIVHTAEGAIRALGTRFSVRQLDGRSRVGVLESAVELTPRAGQPGLLEAGSGVEFTRDSVGNPAALTPASHAWLRGQLIADAMRLDDFLAELGRYRPGLLRCAAEVAGMRVSGAFPLDSTDRILDMLPNVLPVRIRERTRYWITVEAYDPAA